MHRKINIPWQELEITASKSGGPGGQHVNKTSSRITMRWNIHKTTLLTDEEKARIITKLFQRISSTGDLIIHVEHSRSQVQNKELAYKKLHELIDTALKVKKRRMKTRTSQKSKEARLTEKRKHSQIKKLRGPIPE